MAKKTRKSWVSEMNRNVLNQYGTNNCPVPRNNTPVNNPSSTEYRHKEVTSLSNRILYFHISATKINVTTHALYQVLCTHGEVQRIVMYKKKHQFKALVEFVKENDAKKLVCGTNIHSDGFNLKTEYAKVSSLTVTNNNERTWDYTKEPLLKYINGLPTLKSSSDGYVPTNEDSPNDIKSIVVETNQRWETEQDLNLVEIVKIKEKSTKEKSYDHWSELNSDKTQTKRPGFQESEKCSVLSVKGLDATKYNCDRLFRLLSMYASVTRINFLRGLNSANVEIGKCDKIDSLAQIQLFTLSHGNNLSFQYLNSEWSVIHRTIDRFVLPDKSPSYVIYNRRIQTDLSPRPSKIVRFYGAPPDITHDELISLLKPKISAEAFNVKIMTKGTKRKVAYGEIRFTTVSEAIEAVMNINYIIFRSKDDSNKKKYVLNLVFSP